jgi:hypothetical protein
VAESNSLRVENPVLTEDGCLMVSAVYAKSPTPEQQLLMRKRWYYAVSSHDLRRAVVVRVFRKAGEEHTQFWHPVYSQWGDFSKAERERIIGNVITLISMANDGRPVRRRYSY